MKTKRQFVHGTSLIEVLVVLVVFLVGIIAFLQIFPPGLRNLRETRDRTQADSLIRSESQRLAGNSESLPEVIAPVQFLGGNAFIQIDSGLDLEMLYPPMNDPVLGLGEINTNGEVQLSGSPIGQWDRLSGLNRVRRIIGEAWNVPSPSIIGGAQASIINLNFAPIFALSGAPGQLQVYGNDLYQTFGSTDDGIPSPTSTNYDPYEYVLVSQENARVVTNTPFPNEDQVWVGRIFNDANVILDHALRVSVTFYYDDAGTVRPVDAIITVLSTDAGVSLVGNYEVFSIPQIIALGGYAPANYRGFEFGSLRIQRLYNDVGFGGFDAGNPYEYKLLNQALGTILLNPTTVEERVRTANGELQPLKAIFDYSVYDWRILRDEFRVPDTNPSTVKLLANVVRPLSGENATKTTNSGLGGPDVADQTLWVPTAGGALMNDDFILLDVQTGGVIVGNGSLNAENSYTVDKSTGAINFVDVDPAPGLQGYLYIPDTASNAYLPAGIVNLGGRLLRALYMTNSDFAMQPIKAASQYRAVYPGAPVTLAVTQVYPGAAAGWGQPNRIYFPVMDGGQKVTIGEVRVTDGTTQQVLRNQDYRITGREDFAGIVLSYVELPAGLTLDYSTNGFPVRWVRGASMKVRALWNPTKFTLVGDPVQSFENFKVWAQSWRRAETETFEAGASLR